MRKLIDQLNYYTKKYDEGVPEISDKEWDDLYFKLKTMEDRLGICYPDSPTQSINYQLVTSLSKVIHNHKMLSLPKTKDINDIKNFILGKKSIMMYKVDGLTCSLLYQNHHLVRAETRGNGEVGEDITHNAKVISSIPQTIPYDGTVIVDGEICCLYSDFEDFKQQYANPRNFAAGSIRLLDSLECSKRKLTFIAWDWINDDDSLLKRLDRLERIGFTVVPHKQIENIDEIENFASKNKQIPIDGLVIKWDSQEARDKGDHTAHHFGGSLAYKFYDEEYTSKVLDIEYDVSRNGILTPVVVFEPINFGDSIVDRASIHNISVLSEISHHSQKVGDVITVIKSNQIIPQITKWENCGTVKIKMPKKCPVCNGDTILEASDSGTIILKCSNPKCQRKLINQLDYFCGKNGLDIKGLSKATLEKLIDLNWINSTKDIFNLSVHRKEWIQQAGFGPKSVDNILENVEKAKNTTFVKYVAALGIPLIGVNVAKELNKYFNNFSDLRNAINNNYDFSQLDTFGEEKSNSLLNFNYEEADYIYNNYINELASSIEEDQSLKDIIVCITGSLKQYSRNELKKKIENLGGKVTGSVSRKTNYLINNDINSSSSKNKMAKDYNISIISEKDFIDKFFDKK